MLDGAGDRLREPRVLRRRDHPEERWVHRRSGCAQLPGMLRDGSVRPGVGEQADRPAAQHCRSHLLTVGPGLDPQRRPTVSSARAAASGQGPDLDRPLEHGDGAAAEVAIVNPGPLFPATSWLPDRKYSTALVSIGDRRLIVKEEAAISTRPVQDTRRQRRECLVLELGAHSQHGGNGSREVDVGPSTVEPDSPMNSMGGYEGSVPMVRTPSADSCRGTRSASSSTRRVVGRMPRWSWRRRARVLHAASNSAATAHGSRARSLDSGT